MNMQFWMVLADNSAETRVRHTTYENAKAEASRLAAKHPGVKFYVLASCGFAATSDPVQWTATRNKTRGLADEIPF